MAPYRQASPPPDTAPAHGLRAGPAALIRPQTATAMEGVLINRSRAIRPQLEPLDGRCLPSAAISISDVTLAEGHSGQTGFVFTVRLSEANSKPVSVRYATEDGTATAWDRCYSSASGTLRERRSRP